MSRYVEVTVKVPAQLVDAIFWFDASADEHQEFADRRMSGIHRGERSAEREERLLAVWHLLSAAVKRDHTPLTVGDTVRGNEWYEHVTAEILLIDGEQAALKSSDGHYFFAPLYELHLVERPKGSTE